MILAWAVYPLLPSLGNDISDITPVPVPQPSAPATPRSKSQKKQKDTKAKAPAPTHNNTPPTPPAPKKAARQDLSRLLLLPFLPFLTASILRSPTLVGKPGALPYRHFSPLTNTVFRAISVFWCRGRGRGFGRQPLQWASKCPAHEVPSCRAFFARR